MPGWIGLRFASDGSIIQIRDRLMARAVRLFLFAGGIMLVLDAVWLTLAMDRLSPAADGHLMRPDGFDVVAAAAFYLLYLAGVLVLVQLPAADWRGAAWRGAVYGLCAYGTYQPDQPGDAARLALVGDGGGPGLGQRADGGGGGRGVCAGGALAERRVGGGPTPSPPPRRPGPRPFAARSGCCARRRAENTGRAG